MNTQLIKRPALELPIAILSLLTLLFVFNAHVQTGDYFSNAASMPSELKQNYFSESLHIDTRPPTEQGVIANDRQADNAQTYDSNVLFYTPIEAGTFYVSRSGELYYNLNMNQKRQTYKDEQAGQPSMVLKETLVGGYLL